MRSFSVHVNLVAGRIGGCNFIYLTRISIHNTPIDLHMRLSRFKNLGELYNGLSNLIVLDVGLSNLPVNQLTKVKSTWVARMKLQNLVEFFQRSIQITCSMQTF